MGSVWDNRSYKECLIRLQPAERGGVWIPRCTVLYAKAGQGESEQLEFQDRPQATREAAGLYAFDRAKEC